MQASGEEKAKLKMQLVTKDDQIEAVLKDMMMQSQKVENLMPQTGTNSMNVSCMSQDT